MEPNRLTQSGRREHRIFAMSDLPPAQSRREGWPWTEDVAAQVTAKVTAAQWPTISVITPSYNQGEYLEGTLRSVLLQGYPNLEYIVMDGGSSDQSLAILQRYAPWLSDWESEPDRGQSHALNKGLARAAGDIVGWLNSDDILLPGALFRIGTAFQQMSHVDVVHGAVTYVDGQGRPAATTPTQNWTFGVDTALRGSIFQPGAFWRRAMSDVVGPLNESLHYVMDYEYWMRMALHGATFHRLSDPPLAAFRVTAQSKTGNAPQAFGFEHRALIDWYMAQLAQQDNKLASRLALRRQAMKARAAANLKIAQGFALMADQRGSALRWLLMAVVQYPPFLWTRRRALGAVLRSLMRSSSHG